MIRKDKALEKEVEGQALFMKLFPMDTSASQGEIDKIIEEYVIEG